MEVVRVVSLVLVWVALGVNLWMIWNNAKLRKQTLRSLEATMRICRQYVTLRDKYIELLKERGEEVSCEGHDDE